MLFTVLSFVGPIGACLEGRCGVFLRSDPESLNAAIATNRCYFRRLTGKYRIMEWPVVPNFAGATLHVSPQEGTAFFSPS